MTQYEQIAAMIKVREHALRLANDHLKRSRDEEKALRDLIGKIDDYIVQFAIDESQRLEYGLKKIPQKKVRKKRAPIKKDTPLKEEENEPTI